MDLQTQMLLRFVGKKFFFKLARVRKNFSAK